jgi:hypothetical protein
LNTAQIFSAGLTHKNSAKEKLDSLCCTEMVHCEANAPSECFIANYQLASIVSNVGDSSAKNLFSLRK